MEYVIHQTYLTPTKVKDQFPDIIYEYVANTSNIGWHYTFTRNRKDAFVFDSEVYTLDEVKEIAELLGMRKKKLF